MSYLDSAHDQCSDIEYDLLNSEKLHYRDINSTIKWDWLRVKGIKMTLHFKKRHTLWC